MNMRTCQHCGVSYDWRKSPSTSLKMTYCGSLCERADLGYTLDSILSGQFLAVPTARFMGAFNGL